jgi:hypothetical protein
MNSLGAASQWQSSVAVAGPATNSWLMPAAGATGCVTHSKQVTAASGYSHYVATQPNRQMIIGSMIIEGGTKA